VIVVEPSEPEPYIFLTYNSNTSEANVWTSNSGNLSLGTNLQASWGEVPAEMNLYKEFVDPSYSLLTYTLTFDASNITGTVKMFRKKFNSDFTVFYGVDEQDVINGNNSWTIAQYIGVDNVEVEQVGIYLISDQQIHMLIFLICH
jgi:hypothetical protein